jgi:hypothetical protein
VRAGARGGGGGRGARARESGTSAVAPGRLGDPPLFPTLAPPPSAREQEAPATRRDPTRRDDARVSAPVSVRVCKVALGSFPFPRKSGSEGCARAFRSLAAPPLPKAAAAAATGPRPLSALVLPPPPPPPQRPTDQDVRARGRDLRVGRRRRVADVPAAGECWRPPLCGAAFAPVLPPLLRVDRDGGRAAGAWARTRPPGSQSPPCPRPWIGRGAGLVVDGQSRRFAPPSPFKCFF